MSIHKRFDIPSGLNVLFRKKDIVERYIVDESDYFFKRAERIKDKTDKMFFLQIICSTMADSYDLFMDLMKFRHLYSIGHINATTGRKIYKWSALYITAQFLNDYSKSPKEEKLLKNIFYDVFSLTKKERRKMRLFFQQAKRDNAAFQVDFTKYVIHNFVGSLEFDPVMLALMNNFFYNAYNRFLMNYEDYVRTRRQAG